MAQLARVDFTLDDRYRQPAGVVLISGVQALVRALLEQRRLDGAAGIRSAGFVSGYRGSPLGGLDQLLWQQQSLLAAQDVRFQPGVNEELAATAVWGTQQVGLFPGALMDGVFGLWYGKAPGLDRAGDAIRHANAAGTAPRGGVVLAVGDDHGCKSSTLPSHSELTLKDLGLPVLNPADVAEVLEYTLLGWALSRYSGCWVGLIALSDTMDSTSTVLLPGARTFAPPEQDAAAPAVHIALGRAALEQEALLSEVKLPLAARFAEANGINRIEGARGQARLGVVTTGKAYLEVRRALEMLGLPDERALAAAGIRLLKLGMSWPLVEAEVSGFARGLDSIVVVEEKRAFIEESLKTHLYNRGPAIFGKHGPDGAPQLPAVGELSVAEVARVLAEHLARVGGVPERAYLDRLAELAPAAAAVPGHARTDRLPMFCAGCPHNTSTRVPTGSRASAGIGCHYMAQWMDRETSTFTQMGGEGINWVGQAPFASERHVFVNLGDGTYFHSGALAIRQAVASGVNVTYKILHNDAVAMTGGQPVDGQLTVEALVRQLRAEGVAEVAVVSDAPEALGDVGAPVHHRDELDAVQRRFREIAGCSVIVYRQTCATELRRRRKRGQASEPAVRVLINDAVCEGCGDCSVASNCVAVEPLVTGMGVKRQINQTACNLDLSCTRGFCPAFVLVKGGVPKRPAAPSLSADEVAAAVPEPDALPERAGIVIAGVGGTGVVTVSALLSTAAHLDGRSTTSLDMTGLAQKGGAVLSHVRIAPGTERLNGPRIAAATADLLLACDLVTGASRDAMALLDPERTLSVVNANVAPTAEFVLRQQADPDSAGRTARLRSMSGRMLTLDAGDLCNRLLGSTATVNVLLLGFAWQQGAVPVSLAALGRAIELNGTAVQENLLAFHLGRLAAWRSEDLKPYLEQADAPMAAMDPPLDAGLEALLAQRMSHLTAYQNAALAQRYEKLVRRVAAAERALGEQAGCGREALACAVAKSYARLLSYKDEYEVARLYSDGRWAGRLSQSFEPGGRPVFLLAPPLLGARKRRFGGWLGHGFAWLARLKFLRGKPLDPFGYTSERRAERASITHFEQTVEALLEQLNADRHELAVSIAQLPEAVRGFGPVKAAARERWLVEEARQLEAYRRSSPVALFDPARSAA